MKKKFSLLLLPFLTSSIVSAEGFDGFSVGGHLGVNSFQSGSGAIGERTGVPTRFYENSASTLFTGGLMLNYGHVNSKLYFGGELGGSLSAGYTMYTEIDVPAIEHYREKHTIRPAFKFGYVHNSDMLLFASIGASLSKFAVYATPITPSTKSLHSSAYLWGYSVSLGAQILLSQKISTTLEYIYTAYPSKRFPNPGVTDHISIKPKDHIFRLGLSYHFSL